MLLAEVWVHDLDPFAINLGGGWGLRWYGLAYAFGALMVWLFQRHWAKQNRLPIKPAETIDFTLSAFIMMFVFGRLGYVLFYAFDRFLEDPLLALRVWEGGMASHGGIVGLLFGTWLYARAKKMNLWVAADSIGCVVPIGVIAGRIANFINGELWGRPTDGTWGVIFPDAPLVGGVQVPRHPSQLYAAGLEGLLVFVVALIVHKRHRKPGVTIGTVLTLYAIVRFVGEFWRDYGVGDPVWFGWMSHGQFLTLPVFAIGLAMLIIAARQPSRPELYQLHEAAEPEVPTAAHEDAATPKEDASTGERTPADGDKSE